MTVRLFPFRSLKQQKRNSTLMKKNNTLNYCIAFYTHTHTHTHPHTNTHTHTQTHTYKHTSAHTDTHRHTPVPSRGGDWLPQEVRLPYQNTFCKRQQVMWSVLIKNKPKVFVRRSWKRFGLKSPPNLTNQIPLSYSVSGDMLGSCSKMTKLHLDVHDDMFRVYWFKQESSCDYWLLKSYPLGRLGTKGPPHLYV